MSDRIKTYYQLTKPGIIYGNVLTTAAGFFVASKTHIDVLLFFAVMVGTACIIASACVCNNYMDREIDAKMERTKKRALVTGIVSGRSAFIFAIILGFIGLATLLIFTNILTVAVGVIGFIDYVFFYGLCKRRSVHGTLIGGVSGAMPIVAGYTAVTHTFDIGALLLFLILSFWQMPHFYAIAIYRMKDYAAASIPTFPIKKGLALTKIHIFIYLIGYVITTLLLTIIGLTGYVYFIVMLLMNGYWLWICSEGFFTKDSEKWAKKTFLVSLKSLTVFSILLLLTGLLP